MDSMAQIDIGLSEPFRISAYKKIIYKQKHLSRRLSQLKIFKTLTSRPYFAMISIPFRLKNLAQTSNTIRIARKPQTSMKINLNISKQI